MTKKIIACYMILALGSSFLPLGDWPATWAQEGSSSGLGRDLRIEYLEFREVDIKDVLRQLSKQYNLNIAFSKSIAGLVTVQLHNVTIDEALDSIITVNGFVYTKKEDVIKVTTVEEATKEGKQTKVFRLNNADATLLRSSLQKVMSPEGSIEVDTRSNALIVTDIPRVINDMDKMIKDDLDSITQQVLIEARFIEASVGTTEKTGIDWNPTISASGSKRPTTFPFNNIYSPATAGGMFPTPTYTTSYTSPTAGTAATAPTFTPDPNNPGTFITTPGLPAVPGTPGYTTITSAFPFKGQDQGIFGNALPISLASFPSAQSSDFAYGTLDFSQFKATLNLLMTDSHTKVISSPRIVTLDNKRARIQVGETRRVATSQQQTATTTGVQTSYTYEAKDVGVILDVTPHVTPDRHIRMELKPEVSSVTGYEPGTDIQIIGKRIAETELMVKDGQTIVLGGLMQNAKTEATSKIPFLGDLPFLGKLFSHKNIDPNSKTELLIFVTARILNENDRGALAYKSGIITSPPRPLKMELRGVKAPIENEADKRR